MFFIGSDHAGFELKQKLIAHLKSNPLLAGGLEDVGTHSTESCDYPLIAEDLCRKLLAKPGSLGLLICGSGIGVSIAANKINGIRAASVSEPYSARMAREHNDAQILCLGSRVVEFDQALKCVEAFLTAKFDTQNPRHLRRVNEMAELEKKNG